jgi:hypothetical protein
LEYQEDVKTDKLKGIDHMKKKVGCPKWGGWNRISDTVGPKHDVSLFVGCLYIMLSYAYY